MTLVSQRLLEVALERSLRVTTVKSYERLLGRIHLLTRQVHDVTKEECLSLVWEISNPNSRRSTVVAIRAVLGLDLKIPRAVPRRYELPSEDTLRMALMMTPHETRGLLMMYAGLRVGEACAANRRWVSGDRLTVAEQMVEITRTLGPVKSTEATITIPWWLAHRVDSLTGTEQPASVRESLRRAGKKCGIVLGPHALRKWYITALIERGVALELVRKQARHSSLTTTLTHYQEWDPQAIHDVLG
jgi:integrase